MRRPLFALLFLAIGLVAGGYLFSRSLPRSFLAIGRCDGRCYDGNDVAGLLASAAIQRAPGVIPQVVLESDTCIAVRHPMPQARIHLVLFPKRDVKNIATLTAEDKPVRARLFRAGAATGRTEPTSPTIACSPTARLGRTSPISTST